MGYLKFVVSALLLQAAAAQQPQFGTIEGRVTNTSGQALSKVTVSAVGAASPASQPARPSTSTITAVTDAEGKFIFENLRPGTYRLRTARQGFVSREYGQIGPNGSGASVSVSPGQKLNDMNIVITPQGAITGRIVDRNGVPEVRALVQAWRPMYAGPLQGRPLSDIQSTTTDDQGNYRLFWLAPGAYFITATPDGAYNLLITGALSETRVYSSSAGLNSAVRVSGQVRNDGTRDDVSDIATYYPSVANLKDATPVIVRAGDTAAGIDIGIKSVPVYRIRGVTINGNTGIPQSMRVQLSSATNLGTRSISHNSSETGAFEFGGLQPGSYFLMAQPDPFVSGTPVVTSGTAVILGAEDLNNVVVNTPLRSFSISGRISVDDATSNGTESIPGLRIRLTPIISGAVFPAPQVDVRGREFTVRSVFPGDYRVMIEGSSAIYLKSARLGNQDGMDVLHIQSPPDSPLDLELSSRKGGIDGRIVNVRREPVSNATVVLVPDPPFRQRADMYLTPSVDASGKFHMDAIPGFYKLFAWEDVEFGIWLDPAFMFANENRGRPLVVTDGRTESFEVPVIPYVP